MSEQIFLQAKAYLQQCDASGNNIYDLLVNYISKAGSTEGLDFETIIRQLQHDDMNNSYFPSKTEAVVINKDTASEATSRRKLLKKGARKKLTKAAAITNILEDQHYFNEGGIGLGEAEAYALQTSINSFVATNELRYARFVGVVYGLEANYYVMETEHSGEQSEEDVAKTGQDRVSNVKVTLGGDVQPAENPKEGANKFSYWVTNNVNDAWVQLPDVQPAQIVTGKYLKKYFTGRLNAPVVAYPVFPGNEANLLRVQIGRIVAATTIAPKGVYVIPEPVEDEEDDAPKEPVEEPVNDFVSRVDIKPPKGEDEEEEEGEGFEPLRAKQLVKLENWVHLYPNIQETGRVTVYKPPKVVTDEEEEEPEEESDEAQSLVPRLRELQADEGMDTPKFILPKIVKKNKSEEDGEDEEEPEAEEEGEEGNGVKAGQYAAWNIRNYNNVAVNDASVVSIVRSLRWPGAAAYATANGKKNGCIYLGSGFKEQGALNVFTPLLPPPFQQEMSGVPKQSIDPEITMINRVYLGQGPPLDEDAEDDDE